jgi:hypothetical protein
LPTGRSNRGNIASLRLNADHRAADSGAPAGRAIDALLLSGFALFFGLITAVSFATARTLWYPNSPPTGWCLPGQTPTFSFGFADLKAAIGGVMGEPIECEHGEVASNDTFQKTTTGQAEWSWCTNTPMFTSGQEHWWLVPDGVLYWSDDSPPEPRPTVRTPDLRHPCPP